MLSLSKTRRMSKQLSPLTRQGEPGMDNEKFVRSVYQIAEDMDIAGFDAALQH